MIAGLPVAITELLGVVTQEWWDELRRLESQL